VDVSQDVIIRADDCGTNDGITVHEVYEGDELTRPDSRSLAGRRLADPLKHPETGEVLFEAETYLSPEVLEQMRAIEWPSSTRVRIHVPVETLSERLGGRISAETVTHPTTGEVLVREGQEIDRHDAEIIEKAGVPRVKIRSILTCKLGRGVCATCYGHDLSTNQPVEIGEAVGIIAAQSIGEPGTQLTMRTFHLGGVAQGTSLTGVANVKKARQQALQELRSDMDKGNITMPGTLTEQKREIQRYLKVLEATVGGLLRIVELFEARKPKGEAITSAVSGTVVAIIGGGRAETLPGVKLPFDINSAKTGVRKVLVRTEALITERDKIIGHHLAEDMAGIKGDKPIAVANQEVTERLLDQIEKAGHSRVFVQREFPVPYRGNLDVRVGQVVEAGDTLTKGPLWPQDVLQWRGLKGVAEYLVQEVQKVYRSQGIAIHDKHVEVIVRQMLRKRRIKNSGDTELMPGRLVDAPIIENINQKAVDEGLEPATADFVLLGITEAALATESFLSAASFQKTTKVLTEAATHGRVDMLEGLKENVIIGRLIPAGTGLHRKTRFDVELDEEAVAYAEANADLLRTEELRSRPTVKGEVDPDTILPLPTGIEDVAEMEEAGMTVDVLSPDGGVGEDDAEPSMDDLLSADAELDDAELDAFADDIMGGSDE
jgi:DNA-directed RNA polymerase subunit beta'